MRVLLAIVVALASAAPAAAAYRNPTAGAVLAHQIPGMHRAKVNRGLVYRRVGGRPLRMDVYYPRGFAGRRPLPAVLIGGPAGVRAGKDSGQKVGWSQLVAASGLAAVTFDTRSDNFLATPEEPSLDVAAALAYVRARGPRLRLDRDRLCTLGFSLGTAPWHLWATMREPAPFVRCNASYYPLLDFSSPEVDIAPERREEFSALTYLRRHGARVPPLFVAKAGLEEFRPITESIDRFAAEAAGLGAEVRVVTHERGLHGFDVRNRDRRSRELSAATLAFLREHLVPAARAPAARRPRPLRLRETCLSRPERRRVVRFRATDGVRLLGVELGAGSAGVVLAHGFRGDLCSWLPHARRYARGGYRVLVFDHRNHGSSAAARGAARWRVDRDASAAVAVLRRRGATTVVLAGSSMGANAVLAGAAPVSPAVDGVVSLSSPATFVDVDAEAAVRGLTAPTLFVAAEYDDPFDDDARTLYAASAAADKRLELVADSGDHGTALLRNPPIRAAFDTFLDAHSG